MMNPVGEHCAGMGGRSALGETPELLPPSLINRDDGLWEGRAFILAALHLPRRGTPTRFLGQRYGLEARRQRRGPAR
jgi:hypothetical protein